MPIRVTHTATPKDASSIFFLVSAATTNATLIKSGPAIVTGWAITNTSAALTYFCFHDNAGSPVAGQRVYFKFGIPIGGAANISIPDGIIFTNGLTISTVTGAALTNATAVAAQDQIINIFYK